VSVQARDTLTLAGGAAVTVRSDASNAGNIDLRAGRAVQILGTSGRPSPDSATATRVTAEALGPKATGGKIAIKAGQLIQVQDALVTGHAKGKGGEITLDPPVVLLDQSVINGLSGEESVKVRIATDNLFRSGSEILTNAPQSFPETDVSGSLAPLRVAAPSAAATLVPQCGLMLGGNISSFVVTGRGTSSQAPGGWQTDWILEREPSASPDAAR
jgi:hypothetical protein